VKWSNFVALIKRNPDLDSFIRHHIGPPVMHSWDQSEENEHKRREYIESKVAYIAFRVFEELSLSSRDSVSRTINHPNQADYKVHGILVETHVFYKIYYHVGGHEKPFARMAWVGVGNASIFGERAIRECIRSIVRWHEEYWTKQEDRPLIFDMIIKTTKVWDDYVEGVVQEWHEFYRFPQNFLEWFDRVPEE
jgi:hypothetical protein